MTAMSIVKIILLGSYYFLTRINIGNMRHLGTPAVAGLVTGAIMGRPQEGALIGLQIAPFYLAMTGGTNYTLEQASPAIVACLLAFWEGMDPTQGITIGVPIGLILGSAGNGLAVLFGFLPGWATKKGIEQKNERMVLLSGTLFPAVIKAIVYGLIWLMFMMRGIDFIGRLLEAIPEWISYGMQVVYQVLLAAAVGRLAYLLGDKKLFPYFLAGFFFCVYAKALLDTEFIAAHVEEDGSIPNQTFWLNETIPLLMATLTGLFLAFIHGAALYRREKQADGNEEIMLPEADTQRGLTKKDVWKTWLRWWFVCEQSRSYTGWQGLAVCIAYMPVLKKLYGSETEDYTQALRRNMEPFDSESTVGALALGVALAMEEQRALGARIPDEAILGAKNGIAQATHQIGHQLNEDTLYPLFYLAFAAMALTGNVYGILAFVVLYALVTFLEGYLLMRLGYKYGKKATAYFAQSSMLQVFCTGAAIVGLFALGAFGATMIEINTSIGFEQAEGNYFVVQEDILDAILPGMLTLMPILFTYWQLCKGRSFGRIVTILVCVAAVLGALGILGYYGLLSDLWDVVWL